MKKKVGETTSAAAKKVLQAINAKQRFRKCSEGMQRTETITSLFLSEGNDPSPTISAGYQQGCSCTRCTTVLQCKPPSALGAPHQDNPIQHRSTRCAAYCNASRKLEPRRKAARDGGGRGLRAPDMGGNGVREKREAGLPDPLERVRRPAFGSAQA